MKRRSGMAKRAHSRPARQRAQITIEGAVQGVGFRPFIYRLARELHIAGHVSNTTKGVYIEAEGKRALVETFLERIEQERPPLSIIERLESSWVAPEGESDFRIRHSDVSGEKSAVVLPDVATCPDCLKEVFDSSNRRYRYPFTNCTNCGPRFTIIEALPYDRPNTSMKSFTMCAACRIEYEAPEDRRFHAQPNACPACGPHLELWDAHGSVLATHHEALLEAAKAVRLGRIVAVKGLGGFHLVVGCHEDDDVIRLRERKHREEKPLAVMFPSLVAVKAHCAVSELEEQLLLSPECPIVLLRRKRGAPDSPETALPRPIAPSIAPGNPYIGTMLPYTPLHHLLLHELGFPVVATSGNISDEPICIDEQEALERLQNIADLFLIHDRPIVRHVDDSVVRVMAGREQVLRRARGYAPFPINVSEAGPTLLAVGAHLKNTVAIAKGHSVFISQHIGDLETTQAYGAFQRAVDSLERLYEAAPDYVVRDLHPDYLSSTYAQGLRLPTVSVQHHYAHVLACMAEHGLDEQVFGVSWDGTGYGPDGTVWGGEFLLCTREHFERAARFRLFPLPGGEAAVKEPRRSAIGALYIAIGDAVFTMRDLPPVKAFSASERRVIKRMLAKGIHTPLTSSVGRLFDAVAALTGLRQEVHFEGQAAMELEFAIEGTQTSQAYAMPLEVGESVPVVDWTVAFRELLEDLQHGLLVSTIAAKFHNALVESLVGAAKRAGCRKVILTGGCFQNRYLTERAVGRLEAEGFVPFWHRRVPPNDGGIALGQAVAAARRIESAGDKSCV